MSISTTEALSRANGALRAAILAYVNAQDEGQKPRLWNNVIDAAEGAIDAREAFRAFLRGLPSPTKRPRQGLGRKHT